MNEKRFEVLFYGDVINCVRDENGKEYNLQELINILMDQQATIEMYQRRVDKREEQISIIKKHCLKFLTDEQVETIRKELED